jgi:uncharacterized repeat protein (TIGR02543 family)
MKNTLQLFGIIVLTAITGFSMTACPSDGGSPGNTTYTVSYNVNGGSGTTPSSQTVNAGSSVTLASGSGFSKSGYTFGGWNTNSSGTGATYPADTNYTPIGNITLYARWNTATNTTYTVSYNVNGGSGTTPSSQMVNAGSGVTLASGSGFSRSGFTFGGWITDNTSIITSYLVMVRYNAGSSYTVNSNVTFYADWRFSGTYRWQDPTPGYQNQYSLTTINADGTWSAIHHTNSGEINTSGNYKVFPDNRWSSGAVIWTFSNGIASYSNGIQTHYRE